MNTEEIASIIESILFVSAEQLSMQTIKNIFSEEHDSITTDRIKKAIYFLENKYKRTDSGLNLLCINDRVQLVSNTKNNLYVEKILTRKKKKTLSQAAFEVLSIIAYKQPITKIEIDELRGVKSDSVVHNLIEAELIEEKGKLNRIGKPIIYGTTDKFLIAFGLKNLAELPEKIKETPSNE